MQEGLDAMGGHGAVGATAVAPAAASAPWARPLALLSDGLDRLTEAGYCAATAAFASVMLAGVFFRYALNNSLTWSDELALMLFVWATFLSIATAYKHDKHVRIDFLVRSLRAPWSNRVIALAEGLAGGYIIALLVSSLEGLEVAAGIRTDTLQWSFAVPYASIPVASTLMLVHWIRRNAQDGGAAAGLAKVLIALGFFYLVYLPLGQHVQLAGGSRFAVLALALAVPMLVGLPVAFALGLVATTYISVFGTVPFKNGALQIFYGVEILTFIAIPLLILSGTLMYAAGIAERLVDLAQALVGRVRGGLAASNVTASLLFGDISGSTVSDTAAIGALMIPSMKRRGYRPDFCAALQGAAGTLGMTAPLSITILLYAVATSGSVARLAAATILPAFLVALSYVLVALIHAHRHGYPKEDVSASLILPRLKRATPGLFAVVLILGGILRGIFTPAEVGVILLTYVLVLWFLLYRLGQPRQIFRVAIEAGHTSGMTLFMASTSAFVGYVLARDSMSTLVADTIAQITTNKLTVLFFINVVFVLLGMVLEAPAIIFGFLPSFIPLVQRVGIDPLQFGVLFIINQALGMLVPPVALNLFVSTAIAGVHYEQAVKAAVPFMLILVVDMVLITIFPQIPLFLPHVIFGYPIP